jgi:Spy/CpxP family protein refolding chaperone
MKTKERKEREMRRTMILLAVMLATMVNIGVATAQEWWKDPRMGCGPPCADHPHLKGAGIPDLSPEQAQKMQALREKFLKEMTPLRNELMGKEFELRALWLKADLDGEKILAKQKEISLLKVQIDERMIRNRLEMHKVLSSEQRAELEERYARPHGWPGEAYGFGPGPGPGPGCGMSMRFGPH